MMLKLFRSSQILLVMFSVFVCSPTWQANLCARPATAVAQEPAATWERYSAKGEELSVELPAEPTSIEVFRPQDLQEKPKPSGLLYGAYDDGVVYLILSFDNRDRKDPLDMFIKELSQYGINGRADKFEKDLMLDGFTGKQFSFVNGVMTGNVCFYSTRDHVYIVEATSEDMAKPGIGKFFSSLSFNRKLKSKDISDVPTPKADAVGPAPVPPMETVGPGRGGDFEKVLTTKDGIRRALIVARPPPSYTELARQNEINGTVVLRAIFRSSGQVTDIRAVSGLPYGLTEQAIKAARNIKFIPPLKDGRYVSMYVHLEYNFSLY